MVNVNKITKYTINDRGGARGDGGVFESVDAEMVGPGENKPCHVSGCKCKFGYAGNWDAKYCNKCSHEMSKHY